MTVPTKAPNRLSLVLLAAYTGEGATMAESISRGLLSDQVYDLILASILDGSRAPGSRVVESEIARQLGISQAPVREAVKRLVHAGLVVSVARHGSYVTEISPREFAIARQMRATL